jgi:large subunit ribosomal protein L13
VVDAEGQTLGRLSTIVATILMGKHRPDYTPNIDTGDFVVVVNAEKVRLTGKKLENKLYSWHTGYPGGIKRVPAGRMLKEHPERLIEWSVKGMLPKGSLGRKQGTKLKAYQGPEHPHAAQRPEKLSIPA